MKTQTTPTKLLATLALLAITLCASSSIAHAAPPTIDTFDFSNTFPAPMLSAACGFPVTGHIEGRLTVKTFVNKSGGFTKEIDSFHLVNSFTANGHTLFGRTSQQVKVTLLPNGSYTVAFTGADTILTLPGSGVVLGNVGRLVLLFSSDNDLLNVVQEAGQSFLDTEAICAALAP